MKIIKTSKSQYGWYVQLDDNSYKGCTEAVSNFLKGKIPCEIEVLTVEGEGKQEKISRVNLISKPVDNSANEFEQPVEMVNPGKLVSEGESKTYISEVERQKSIESQMCIYAALQMIEIQNKLEDKTSEELKPTQQNVLNTARLVRNILDELKRD